MVTHIKNAIDLSGKPLNIAIDNGIITEIKEDALLGEANTVIDACGKLAIPGLINCHTHSYMSVFRNIADDVDFETWLFRSIMPLEDRLTNEDAYYGAMLSRGATTFWEDFHMDWLDGSGRIDELPTEGQKDIHGDYGAFCYEGFRHSLCHGWASGVYALFVENIIGLKIENGEISVNPNTMGIKSIKASIPIGNRIHKFVIENNKCVKI